MRCPKCGYISFDHLTACSHCSRDLTTVAEELRGTAMETELSLFLGAVIGEETPEAEPRFADQAGDETAELILADQDSEESEITIQLDESAPEAAPTGADQGPDFEAPPELTLDMDEIPAFDLAGVEAEAAAEPAEPMEMTLAEAGEFPAGQEEQLTLNLDEIDLSDLAPLDEEPAEAALPAEPELELTLDLGTETEAGAALDLGALEEDQAPILDLEDFMLGTGLERTAESPEADELQALLSNKAKGEKAQEKKEEPTVDELDLDLDLDLSLDLPDPAKGQAAPPELKLSLESEDDKS